MRFKIVRPEDVGFLLEDGTLYVSCDRVIDPPVLSENLALIRRALKVEDWYIDMANRCIIPKPGKDGNCYGQDKDIEYSSAGCGGAVACTHFASLCYNDVID